MLALTGPRVQTRMRPYDKALELDARLYARARTLIERALEGGRHLTREELSAALRRGRIEATGQRLAYLVMHAELEGIICSGPRRGKQFTYALLAERAPRARTLARDEALAELARRYFTSHGPATLRDFVWWSGLRVKDAALGVALGKVRVLPSAPERRQGAGRRLPAAELRRVPDRLPRPCRGRRRGPLAHSRLLASAGVSPPGRAGRPRRRRLAAADDRRLRSRWW